MAIGAPLLIEAHGKLAGDSRVAGGAHIRALSHDDRVMEVEDNTAHNQNQQQAHIGNIFDQKSASQQHIKNQGGQQNWAQPVS